MTGPGIPAGLKAALADRYRIERELGAGGMATVYLAEDLRHKRKVAVKVLRPELAAVLGADRFVQEIETTAQLQHPHILPLFDSGTADGFLFYVMPYVEGETLRDKLDRETQLGVDEAVRIAREVADALDYAHRQGVIHRDIKPENILLHDGRPMVADFGIALAVSAAAGGRMTETGTSIGTPHYMSPEQATADREITGRADIYSLASVLYEMLTGEPPHTGSTAQAVIMKIIADTPRPVSELRKSVPPNVAAAVMMALEKLPADRFESAKAFREALVNPAFTTATGATATAGLIAQRTRRLSALVVTMTCVAFVSTALAAWGWFAPPPRPPVARFLVSVPDDRPLAMGQFREVGVSPDGARFAYIGIGEGGVSRVFVREIGAFDVLPVAGSANADEFAFSPSGMEMIVRVEGQLRRTGWAGEAPRAIADSAFVGPVWGDDDFVYFTDAAGALVRIPAGGGRVETMVTGLDAGTLSWSDVLPNRRGGLFVVTQPAIVGVEPTIMIADFGQRSTSPLTRGTYAVYRSGRVIILKSDGSMWVARFDADRLSMDGELIAVPSQVIRNSANTPTSVAVSSNGTLLYQSSPDRGDQALRVQRDGKEIPYPFYASFTLGPRLSPDGRRMAATLLAGPAFDVHVIDLANGITTRLTFDGVSGYPDWSADGRRVAFYSVTDSGYQLRSRAADASTAADLLVGGPAEPVEVVFSPDGRSFITREGDRSVTANAELVRYEVGGDSMIRTPLTRTAANERSPMVSPDGRFVAYVSDESGRDEVYVRETRPSQNVWPVSRDGGREPLWARSGRELFYRGGGKLRRVGVQTTPTFAVTESVQDLFPVGEYLENLNHTAYGILPGDTTFVFVKVTSLANRLGVVLNWMNEVDRIMEGAGR